MLLAPSCLLPLILLALCIPTAFPFVLQNFIDAEALDVLRSSKKMDEFIKHLGIKHEGLCHPDTDVNMEPMFNEDLAYGDLLMDEEEMEETDEEEHQGQEKNDVENDFEEGISPEKQTDKKSKREPKKWVNGEVPYYISRDFTSEQKQEIENAIEEMDSKLENVNFRPVEKLDRNYIIIFNGKGCYANLGMKGGQQPVSLQADQCLKIGTIQHELMHILGFMHEQNRPDRDDYIKILYNNIPQKWKKSYKRYKPYEARYVGNYDYYSVLHYPPQAPRSRGKKLAFKILEDDVDVDWVGNRERISELDLKKADELYSDE